jgi:hypothetical protein
MLNYSNTAVNNAINNLVYEWRPAVVPARMSILKVIELLDDMWSSFKTVLSKSDDVQRLVSLSIAAAAVIQLDIRG